MRSVLRFLLLICVPLVLATSTMTLSTSGDVQASFSESSVSSDAVNNARLEAVLSNYPGLCFGRPATMHPHVSLLCDADFYTNKGGNCDVSCTAGVPSAFNVTCDPVTGWSEIPQCYSSCSSVVVPGVNLVQVSGQVVPRYCDGNGYTLLGGVEGSTSGNPKYYPTVDFVSGGKSLSASPVPTEFNGILSIVDNVPVNTPLKFVCTKNSGMSWSTYTQNGISSYTPNRYEISGSSYWYAVGVGGALGYQNAYICGKDESNDHYNGIGLCEGSKTLTGGASHRASFTMSEAGIIAVGCDQSYAQDNTHKILIYAQV